MQNCLDQLARHYNESYYASGRGGYQPDARYFSLLALYWRKVIFEKTGRDPEARILDFGAGLGLVTARCPHVVCVEHSDYAAERLQQAGRSVVRSLDELPSPGSYRSFQYILVSHVLEHLLEPSRYLLDFHRFLRPRGELIIIAPFEKQTGRPCSGPDINRHFYCWTFQTLVNLVHACGWEPTYQGVLLNPCGLRSLGLVFGLAEHTAVHWAARIAGITRFHRSILVIAKEAPGWKSTCE